MVIDRAGGKINLNTFLSCTTNSPIFSISVRNVLLRLLMDVQHVFNMCNIIYMWGIQRIKGQQVNWRPWNVTIDNLKRAQFCGGMCSTIVSNPPKVSDSCLTQP
jgi:hypothetical protein